MDSTVILGGGYTCSECGQWNRTSALCNHFSLIPSIKMDKQEENQSCPTCGGDSWKYNSIQSEEKHCKCGTDFYLNNIDRQEGYYWVKYKKGPFAIGYWNLEYKFWSTLGNDDSCEDTDFEHINEVRIKQPGELPD